MKIKKSTIVLVLIIGFLVPVFSITKIQENSVQKVSADAPLQFYQKWNYTVSGTYISGTPTLYDLYEDGTKEVIFGTGNQGLFCIDHEGNYNWSYSTNSAIRGSPAIADVDYDEEPNIVVGINDRLRFFDYDGSYITQTSTGWIMGAPTVVDFEDDGVWEFLTPSYGFYDGIYCIDSNGQIRWSYTDISTPGTPDRVYSSPTVCDLDGDDVYEVLFGSWDGNVYCLNETGDFQWSTPIGGQVWGSPIVVDVDNDNYFEVIAGAKSGDFYCLTYDGGTLWNTNVVYPIVTSAVVGDLDKNGQYEVYIGVDGESGTSTAALHSFNGIDGSLNWYYNGSTGFSHAPAIADVDGDGFEEIVMVTSEADPALVSVVTSSGSRLENMEITLDGWATSTPVIADIDNDNYMEIIVGDGSGVIYCLGVENAAAGTGTQWHTLGGSFFRNGHPDRDQDYIDELAESALGTDETNNDSDSDLLLDGIELFSHRTDPLDDDTDDDNVTDYDEIVYFGTDPTRPDSDYDGLTDRFELDYGTDPWDDDTDNDLLLDGEEWITYGSNPLLNDTDGDGLDDYEEVSPGEDGYITGVTYNDTDSDGLLDGEEVNIYGTHPLDADTDDDTILDGEEVTMGDDGYITNATNADTDGDGYDDNDEIDEGTDPTDPNDNPSTTETPTPTPTNTTTTTPTGGGAFIGGFVSLGIVLITAFSIIALVERRKKYFK